MHAEAKLLGLIYNEGTGLPNIAVGFTSIVSARLFINEMTPREVDVRCMPAEDAAVLLEVLTCGGGVIEH
jgi:hypothetical protein